MTTINSGVLDGVRQSGLKVRDASVTGGLPGAPLGLRLRGATTSGSPASGTWKTGDLVPDRTGALWACTAGGTPGTWVQVGGGAALDTTSSDIQADGTQAAGGSAKAAAANHVHPENMTFTAADAGYLAWNFDIGPAMVGSTALTGGKLYIARVNIRTAISVTNVIFSAGTAGSGLTSNENFAGLYNSSGSQIGGTADQSTNWQSQGIQTMALTGGPYNLSAGTFVWVAILSNGTTTVAPARGQNQLSGTQNAGFTVSTVRWATTSGTAQTSLPASFTPASSTYAALSLWVALS